MIDTTRGSLRVRAWPKKRGKPKHPHTLYMNRWFADAMRKMKFVDPQQMDVAIKWTRNTGLYPRDIIMAAATRGLFRIPDPENGILEYKRKGLYEVAFQGVINEQTVGQAILAGVFTKMVYPLAQVDTAAMWEPNPLNRIVIPAGVNIVNVFARQLLAGSGVNRSWCFIQKNGGPVMAANESDAANTKYASASTGPIPVVEGDFFEHFCQSNGAETSFVPYTGFALEILDANFPPAT